MRELQIETENSNCKEHSEVMQEWGDVWSVGRLAHCKPEPTEISCHMAESGWWHIFTLRHFLNPCNTYVVIFGGAVWLFATYQSVLSCYGWRVLALRHPLLLWLSCLVPQGLAERAWWSCFRLRHLTDRKKIKKIHHGKNNHRQDNSFKTTIT